MFWAVISGLLLGVMVRSFFTLGFGFVALGLVIGMGLLFLQQRSALVLALVCIGCALGVLRMQSGIVEPLNLLDAQRGNTVVLQGTVSAEPDAREKSTRLTLDVDSVTFASSTYATNVRVLVNAPPYTNVSFGDRVSARGTVGVPEAFDTGLGREFKYDAYLAKDGILYELSFAQVSIVSVGEMVWYQYFEYGALWVKQQFERGIGDTLSEPQAGLAAGITVGDKRGIGATWSEIFRSVGLTHIIVLSGYNIMVVIGFFSWALSGARRSVQILGGMSVAFFFILMTGFASATVRASLMASIAVVGRVTGRVYLASRALALVALGIVMWNPYVLAFDPGFQLSVLATGGLIWIAPLVSRSCSMIPERYGLREIVATSIGTQVAVFPLLLYQTGTLSSVSLPANILVLVIIPLAMMCSFVAGVCGALLGSWGVWCALPAHLLLSYVLWVAEKLSLLPFAQMHVPAFSIGIVIVLYGIMMWWVLQKQTAGN